MKTEDCSFLEHSKLSIELMDRLEKIYGEKQIPIQWEETELYTKELFDLLFKILSTFETLNAIPAYLNNLPSKVYCTKHGIEKSQYYRYHIENYIIRSTTLFDQLVLFINKLYELGIDPKKCGAEIVFSNQHAKDSKEVKLAKEYLKSINGIKETRNLVLHRGEFNDVELDDVISREFFKKYKKKESSKELKLYVMLEDFVSKKYKSKRVRELVDNTIRIMEFLNVFFFVAHETFLKRIEAKEKALEK